VNPVVFSKWEWIEPGAFGKIGHVVIGVSRVELGLKLRHSFLIHYALTQLGSQI
jgi:hypothetical protein